jgi:hypothetical protein
MRNPKEVIKFRADPALRLAIRLRAVFEDRDMQDVIADLLRAALAEEINEVVRRGLCDPPPGRPPGTRGRKRRGGPG